MPTVSRHTKQKISSIISYTRDVELQNDNSYQQMENKLEKRIRSS